MDFKILDASAFYAGVPFKTSKECHTTNLVYDEIRHIKKNHDALGILLETKRLKISVPDKRSIEVAINAAKETGDYPQLSKQDISIIALCIEVKGEMISDDFAILNVIRNRGLKTSPIMSKGIKDVGKWIHYCPGCRINYKNGKECPSCGTPLKRKLLKERSSLDSFNK